MNVPVEFTSPEQTQPLTINPGDLIVADMDGVVVIPPSKVDELVEICDRLAVIAQGRLSPAKPIRETSAEEIGLLMAGAAPSGDKVVS